MRVDARRASRRSGVASRRTASGSAAPSPRRSSTATFSSRMPRMPCSGLKSATSVTSFGACSRSIVRRAVRARGRCDSSPGRCACPRSRANPSARRTSMPVWTAGDAAGAGRADGTKSRPVIATSGGSRRLRWRPTPRSTRLEPAARVDVTVAVGVHAVRQEDDPDSGQRIDPDRRARESRVTERADRQQLTAVRRVRAVQVPAQAASGAAHIGGRPGHRGHRQRRQNARAVPRATRQQHPHEDRQVLSRREEAGMAGIPAHSPRGGIVDDASQHRGA